MTNVYRIAVRDGMGTGDVIGREDPWGRWVDALNLAPPGSRSKRTNLMVS